MDNKQHEQDYRNRGVLQVKNTDILFDKIRENKNTLFKAYSVTQIGIFGSYVRVEETPQSDVDVLVDFEKPIDIFRFVELEENLS